MGNVTKKFEVFNTENTQPESQKLRRSKEWTRNLLRNKMNVNTQEHVLLLRQ